MCGVSSVVSDSFRPMDCRFPGSSVHGNLQARIQGQVSISFPRGSSLPRNQTQVSCIAVGKPILLIIFFLKSNLLSLFAGSRNKDV